MISLIMHQLLIVAIIFLLLCCQFRDAFNLAVRLSTNGMGILM